MIHAIQRAKERYGLDLTRDDMLEINRMIREGSPLIYHLPSREPGTLDAAVRFKHRWLYMKAEFFGVVITFLPRERLIPFRKHLDAYKKRLIEIGSLDADQERKPMNARKRARAKRRKARLDPS